MAIISTRINELPLVQDPTQFEIPGFNIQTNAGGKARMSDLVGPTGPSPNVSIVAHSIPNGQNPTVTKGGTNLNPTYDFGIPVAADGRTPELRVSDGYIQYRYGTDPWVNLISISEITGPNGEDGINGIDGKTAIFQAGSATPLPSGEQPTIQVSNIGYDANNNPIYSISLGIPNGEQGSPGVPITLVNGTIQTGAPGSNVSLTFTYSGENIAGQPIYRVDGSIPQGMPGSGNGNVQVTESGLVSGNQYVFVPNSDNTAIGTFQPITLPIQMQPDYAQVDSTATDYIKNKPNLSPNFVTSNAYTSTANGVSETVQVRSIQNGVGQPVTVQFPMVTDSQAGAMPASAFTQIQQNTSDINSLKSSGGKRWPSQATKAALDSYGVPSGGAQNDVITVRADESQGNATTQYVLIDSGSGLQWVFDYIVNSAPISIATESNLGLVKGSNIDGQQFTDVDGTLSTVGWDALKQRVTDVETELLTKGNSTAIFRRPSVGTVIYDGIDFYMTIYSSTEIRAHSKITTTISPEITQTRFEADNASTIKRSINISPSVSSVIGSVSTTTLVMDVIIGTNKEYIRITCQCTGVTSVLTQAQIIVEKLM